MESRSSRVKVIPRRQFCRATIRWDSDSSVLACTLHYEDEGPSPLMRERIDAALEIKELQRRLVLNDADILLDARQRPESIEVYTNPASWMRGPLSEPAGPIDDVWVRFEIDYDDNGIASLDVPFSIRWDRAGRGISLCFGPVPCAWYALADRVLLGVSDASELSEIRYLGADFGTLV
jgi:hypothetical protein